MEHEAASAASHLMTCSVCEPPGSSHSSLDDFDACIASEGSILETAAHGHGRGASTERMQAAVRTLLAGVGEDPDRQGLRDTPKVSHHPQIIIPTTVVSPARMVCG